MGKAARYALYGVTLAVLLAMTPVRLWLHASLATVYKSPDISPGMSLAEVEAFRDAMALPVAGKTGGEWFLALHTFTLDLALPLLLGLTIAVFFLNAARKLPRFAALGLKVQRVVAALLALPYVAFDYRENFRVWQLLSGAAEPDEAFAGSLAGLTTLKFTSLALAAIVCLTFALATLRTRKTT